MDFFVVKGYKPVGSSDNGICERCGTLCPKQTVIMAAVDAEGLVNEAIYAHWGVCCAAQYCFGAKTERNRKKVLALVQKEEEYRRYQVEQWNGRIATDNITIYYQNVAMGIHAYLTEKTPIAHHSVREAANVRYMQTGLPRVGSFMMTNNHGHEVRVCSSIPGEVAYYTSIGFAQVTDIVAV